MNKIKDLTEKEKLEIFVMQLGLCLYKAIEKLRKLSVYDEFINNLTDMQKLTLKIYLDDKDPFFKDLEKKVDNIERKNYNKEYFI